MKSEPIVTESDFRVEVPVIIQLREGFRAGFYEQSDRMKFKYTIKKNSSKSDTGS